MQIPTPSASGFAAAAGSETGPDADPTPPGRRRRLAAAGALRLAGCLSLSLSAAVGVAAAQTTRVSVTQAGAEADQGSRAPSIGADGRWVAFESNATNLVAGDANGVVDVFLKDRTTGIVTRVSAPGAGGTDRGGSRPAISASGRFVAFTSVGALLTEDTNSCPVPEQPSDTCGDVYVYDHNDGSLQRVSLASNGAQGNGPSGAWGISEDGRFVAFHSTATNLVANDTNGVVDVFLRDRQEGTTTRISVSSSGGQSPGPSAEPSMSDDGSVIVFTSAGGTALDDTTDPLRCPADVATCLRVFVHERATGATRRLVVNLPMPPGVSSPDVHQVAQARVSGDGRFVGLVVSDGAGAWEIYIVERATGRVRRPGARGSAAHTVTYALSRTGRHVATCDDGVLHRLTLTDYVTGLVEYVPEPPQTPPQARHCEAPQLSADGLTAVFVSDDTDLVAADANSASDVFAFDRDTDDDGMPTAWETFFKLSPGAPGDAAFDADEDGTTNLDEYLAGTNPIGRYTRYLAEGAANGFFLTQIWLLNPDSGSNASAAVSIRYFGANGATRAGNITLDEGRNTYLQPVSEWAYSPALAGHVVPDDNFSTLIESDRPIVVERQMRWLVTEGGPARALGSHAETAIAAPRTTWHLAEGATHGPFSLFYLVQNPGDLDTEVRVTYLLPAPAAPIVQAYTARAHSRLTIPVDDQPGLAATDVSAQIVADHPVLVERAMYLSTAAQPFAGGHEGAAIAEPLTEWFVAEGVTGGFFSSYLLIGNPGQADAELTISYFLEDGTTFDKTYVAARQSRLTISLNSDDPRLAATSLSARIRSTNGVPVVVERATWWPGAQWYEGHLTAASSGTSRRWGVASAPIDFGPPATSTFLLIANPNATAAIVTIRLKDGEGPTTALCQATVDAPAHSRVTVDLAGVCGDAQGLVPGRAWGGTVESDGPEIVVERATYRSGWAGLWSAGSATALTKLP